MRETTADIEKIGRSHDHKIIKKVQLCPYKNFETNFSHEMRDHVKDFHYLAHGI